MRCMETSKPSRTEIQPGIWADSRRAIFIEPLRLLVVADLHWGFARAHRAAGNLVPLWGDEEIARVLRAMIFDYAPAEMLWLGDSLHRLSGRAAAENFLSEMLQQKLSVTVLAGNHDRGWSAPSDRTAIRGNYFFHHGDISCTPIPPQMVEVVGHFHPAAGLSDGAGMRLRIPALVASPRRLILPAFSPWAAGVEWNRYLEKEETLWAVAPSRIFAVRKAQPSACPASS
jgi:uncharacterized protein